VWRSCAPSLSITRSWLQTADYSSLLSGKNCDGQVVCTFFYCVQLSRVYNNSLQQLSSNARVRRMLPTQASKLCLGQIKWPISALYVSSICCTQKVVKKIVIFVFVLIFFVIVLLSFCQVLSVSIFVFVNDRKLFSLTILFVFVFVFVFASEVNTAHDIINLVLIICRSLWLFTILSLVESLDKVVSKSRTHLITR